MRHRGVTRLVTTLAVAVMVAYAGVRFASSQAGRQSTSPAPQKVFKTLVLSDDFSNLTLNDPARKPIAWWQYPHAFFANWKPRGELIDVQNGTLKLTAVPPPNATGTTAAIVQTLSPNLSQGLFFYGYFEARLRFDPNGKSMPSFWLISPVAAAFATAGKKTVGDPAANFCEIDIMETFYPKPGTYQGTVHDWERGYETHNANAVIQLPAGTDLSGWNTFGLLWRPGKLSWYVNNRLVSTAPSPPICDKQKLGLVLSEAAHPGAGSQTLQVAWVHVYQ